MASEFRIITQLDALIQKTALLMQSLDDARQRIAQLERENEALHESRRDYQNQLKEAKEKEAKLPKEVSKKPAELPQPFINPKEIGKIVSDNPAKMVSNAEIKQKLDEYIQEIDRCIAHLNNLS